MLAVDRANDQPRVVRYADVLLWNVGRVVGADTEYDVDGAMAFHRRWAGKICYPVLMRGRETDAARILLLHVGAISVVHAGDAIQVVVSVARGWNNGCTI